MIFDLFPVLAAFPWGDIIWAITGCVIAFLALLMIITIVFLQDANAGGGLGGAFGSAGGGGDALLGAGGQKGIVKITAILSIVFVALVIIWGMDDLSGPGIGTGSGGDDLEESIKPPSTGAGAGTLPGLSPGGVQQPPPGGNTGTSGSSGGSGN